jgi:hypothetical protein
VEVDGPQEVEELDAMLGELRKVLVDHVQSALEHVLHDHRDLVLHKALIKHVSHRHRDRHFNLRHTESLVIMAVMAFRTSASRAPGTLRL